MSTYHIITFGCQMNEHDSELMAGMLENIGYIPAEELNSADIVIVNTCCVRETAENKVFGLLGRLGKIKRQKPELIIAMGGCMSQQEHVGTRIKQRFPYVDIVFGTHNIHTLPDLVARVSEKRQQIIDIWPENKEATPNMPVKRKHGLKGWVSIMYGCNNFCTYCIVPYVRGRERSRRPEEILQEIRSMADQGYKDITLLGQNVNSYGKDLTVNIDFSDLLSKINSLDGIQRIRFMTSHPRDFYDKLIQTVADLPKVCEHIHLPVQAGSNNILKRMNRGYDREYYFSLADKIRKAIPSVSLTTDIMVGFPGETEKDFADTVDLVERVHFDSAFTFIYNVRKGTPAAKMENHVPDEQKTQRIQKLINIQNSISLARNRSEVGQVFECLVEGPSRTNDNFMSARTRSNKIVVFKGHPGMVGEILPLRITGYGLTHLEGEVIPE